MELNRYQKTVIADLALFLGHLQQQPTFAQAYTAYWAAHPLKCPDDNKQYINTVKCAPNVCLKVPTAGGKTFIAVNALHTIFDSVEKTTDRVVVWLVPSDAIRSQTYKALNDPKHPYRQKLNELFFSRVKVYQDEDLISGGAGGFSPTSVRENLNILIISYQALRITNTADRKVFQSNGNLSQFFKDVKGDEEWLLRIENGEYDSLVSVLRKYTPVVVIDEAHNARSPLSTEMLSNLNPAFILEITATPRRDTKKKEYLSNIISYVGAGALKAEKMIKLPILFHSLKNVNDVYSECIILQNKLETAAKTLKYYIRPIVLLQAQPKNQAAETETIQKIKAILTEQHHIPATHIGIKSSGIDTIKGEDLMSKNCEIRYIITIDALKEGWDCPFAYILASVANKSSEVQIEQLVGRVLRNPYIRTHAIDLLNMSYVLISSTKFQEVLQRLIDALNHQGIDKKQVKAVVQNPDLFENTDAKDLFKNGAQNGETAENEGENSIENPNADIVFMPNENENNSENNTANGAENTPENTGFNPQIAENMLAQAQKMYAADANQAAAAAKQGIQPVAPEQQQPLIEMHTAYTERVKNTRLPQFAIKMPVPNAFGEIEWLLLSQTLLLTGFKLHECSTNIDFAAAEIELYKIELSENTLSTEPNASMVEEKQFVYVKASEREQHLFLAAIAQQSQAGQIKSLVGRIKNNYFKDYSPVSDKDIEIYLTRLLEYKTKEELKEFTEKFVRYAPIIKQYADAARSEYAYKAFEKGIHDRSIKTQPSFIFPDHLHLKYKEQSIAKSLYSAYPPMNDFEKLFASNIAALPNVVCWHKFNDRNNKDYQQAFMLNGAYLNHYPDFVLFLESGLIVIVETKGRLDANDQKKNKLGKKWQEVAGRDYAYYMVTQTDMTIEDTIYFPEFIKMLKKL